VYHNGTAVHLTRSDCEGVFFKKCCISNEVDGTDDTLWDGCEEGGNVKTVRKMKALIEDGDGDTDWYR